MLDTDVVIAGAGPTGLMLASELLLAGIDVLLLDQLDQRQATESRAGGLHARTLELLDQRGIVDRFLAAGRPTDAGHFSAIPVGFGALASRYSGLLLLQHHVERLLEERVTELGGQVRWSSEVVAARQDDTGVDIEISGPHGIERVRTRYLVGCDGGHSTVRKLAGIDFPGTPPTMVALLGDVELSDPPDEWIFQRRTEHGDYSVLGLEPGWYRVFVNQYDQIPDRDAPVTLEQLRAALVAHTGTDFGMHSPRWLSRFSDAARQAGQYRKGRILLAGDAAHIHFPAGGQGMNLGIQDAANLGWKLALVLRGHASDQLLDSYHAERHPVGARVLDNTRAQAVLGRPGAHTNALRAVFAELVGFTGVNEHLANMVAGLDIRYPLGEGHPLLGRRVPDVDLTTADAGAFRLVSLLHAGRPVLLDLTSTSDVGELAALASAWADRVDLVRAHCPAEKWTVPGVGAVAAPAAVLIRPDGYLAWVAPAASRPHGAAVIDTAGLRTALTTWFGPATAGSVTG